MNRRRFFGEEKPKPLYIFQSGVGFNTNPKEGVTLKRANGKIISSKEYILLEPDDMGDGTYHRDYMTIGLDTSSAYPLVIDFSAVFPGYQTLYIDAYNEDYGSPVTMAVGTTTRTSPDIADASDWIQRSVIYNHRTTVSFDIRGITARIGAVGGVVYIGGEKAYGRIYNIWLE